MDPLKNLNVDPVRYSTAGKLIGEPYIQCLMLLLPMIMVVAMVATGIMAVARIMVVTIMVIRVVAVV
jgi:hypothetical protein